MTIYELLKRRTPQPGGGGGGGGGTLIGAHAAKLQGTCVFLPFWGSKQRSCGNPLSFYVFLLGVKQRSCETPIVFVLFPVIIRGQAAKLRDTYCFRTVSYYWGSSSEAARHLLFSYCFLLLGVKQRSCETPIVFVLFPIIRGQAAKLRDTYCFRTFSYYYYPAIGVYGSP